MGDLHTEIHANIELVHQKQLHNAPDTLQFVEILAEDIKQFLACMREEAEQVVFQIGERDEKCKDEVVRVIGEMNSVQALKEQLTSHPFISSLKEQAVRTTSPIKESKDQESKEGELFELVLG